MRRIILALIIISLTVVGGWSVRYFGFRTSKPAATPQRMLVGVVSDPDGPVAGARVRVLGSSEFVLTDESGQFSLPFPAEPLVITAWKEGYTIGGIRSDSE